MRFPGAFSVRCLYPLTGCILQRFPPIPQDAERLPYHFFTNYENRCTGLKPARRLRSIALNKLIYLPDKHADLVTDHIKNEAPISICF